MKLSQLGVIACMVVLLVTPSLVLGATIRAGIDGVFVDVPTFTADDGTIQIGSQVNPVFVYNRPSIGNAEMRGILDPDPYISFAIAATDPGAASTFSFSYVLPLVPQPLNPTRVSDSLSGSVTNGASAGGVTVTALAPPDDIPTDGTEGTELQVYTLSDDNGQTWQNVGLDAGPTTAVPLGSFASGPYGFYNQGYIPTIAGGPWTHMRVDINFRLSGGGDIFTLNGAKVLIPEPSSMLLGLAAVALVGLFRPRSARS